MGDGKLIGEGHGLTVDLSTTGYEDLIHAEFRSLAFGELQGLLQ